MATQQSRVDALRDIVVAYERPNNSKAETARVMRGLKAIGFEGQELADALRMLGWHAEGDAIAMTIQERDNSR